MHLIPGGELAHLYLKFLLSKKPYSQGHSLLCSFTGSNSHQDRTSPHTQGPPSAKAFGGLPRLVHTRLSLPKRREIMLPSFWGPLAHTPNSVQGTHEKEHSYLHILRHAHSTCMHAHVQEQDSTHKPIWRKHLHFPPYTRGTFYRIMETLLPVFWLKELTTNKRDIGCP